MKTLPLLAVPRQQFTATLDGARFDITLQAVGNCMYATILRNEVLIVSAARCVAGFQIMPARWMESTVGNFAFLTPSHELPWWQNFTSTHTLYYASSAELAAVRGGHASV